MQSREILNDYKNEIEIPVENAQQPIRSGVILKGLSIGKHNKSYSIEKRLLITKIEVKIINIFIKNCRLNI